MTTQEALYFDRLRLSDFASLLGSYRSEEFNSATRSTVPLLSFIKDERRLIRNIMAEFGTKAPWDFHFEYTVEPPIGRGKPSHTDLMVFSASHCLAIETKWTEPPYERVADWVAKSTSSTSERGYKSNREAVLAGWLRILSCGAPLASERVGECEYQMLHRAASAVHAAREAGSRPQLVYFKFSPSVSPGAASPNYYAAHLELLSSRLGKLIDFPFSLVEIQILPTPAFRSLQARKKGESSTGAYVNASLRELKLFDFEDYRVRRIG